MVHWLQQVAEELQPMSTYKHNPAY
ncbi:unnamed protein product [Spirodela intermedia]|uniref:Uncharacterized protein n=2 Tax=Spirodela intermedia TaxID=51605 RepID=A0A7I8JGQ4_SPIIN|nr:unnamed protein product [Spirodela intermedia]CAA6669320.1 unnamed protein product [Spirodela intermedia]CAA7406268.1 unnamed protein product [Spirodela intermedia]